LSLYIFEKSSSSSCRVSHYQSLFPLQQVLKCFSPVAQCLSLLLVFQKPFFLPSIFAFSSGLSDSQRDNFAATYIVLLMSVISDPFSSKRLSVLFQLFYLPTLSIYYFTSVLVNFHFGTCVLALLHPTPLEGLPLAYA